MSAKLKSIFKYSSLLVSFILILLFFYSGIDKVYYQQDEWYTFGKTIFYAYSNFFAIFNRMYGIHYIPLANVYYVIEFILFGISSKYYLYTGIVLQAISGLTFYLLTKRLFRDGFVSLLLSVFFLINVEIYQIYLVEVVSYYTLSTIFVNILFIKLYDYINNQKFISLKQGILLISLFASAILIHEIWFSLIALVPLFILLFRQSSFKLKTNRNNLTIVSIAVIFILIRLMLEVTLPADNIDLRSTQSSGKTSTVYNIATVPFKTSVQYLVGLENVYSLSKFYQKKISYYKTDVTINQDLMAITTGYDLIVFYVALVFIIASLVLFYIVKPDLKFSNRYVRILIFSIAWICIMGVIVSPQNRFFYSIESRYIYLFSEGIGLLLGSVFFMVFKAKKLPIIRKVVAIGGLTYLITFGTYSYYQTQTIKDQVILVSSVRRNIINQIKRQEPVLGSKTIFYLQCSDDCTSNNRLGMPSEWIVPFQNGFGWTLLVVYSGQNVRRYAPFFERDTFLWERGAEGYKEINGTGFGFFTDRSQLKSTVLKYKLNVSNVIGLKYESKKYKIIKMSNNEIRELLKKKSL